MQFRKVDSLWPNSLTSPQSKDPAECDHRGSMSLRVGWSLCLRGMVDGFSLMTYLFSSGGQKFKIMVSDRMCSGAAFPPGMETSVFLLYFFVALVLYASAFIFLILCNLWIC